MEIDDVVARTLFIPLYMKAKETRREEGFFQDEHACRLVDEVNFDFSPFDGALRSQVGCALRANYFDGLVKEFIESHPTGVIVNVGCGLDTRFERISNQISWPETATLYDFDLPQVIELRNTLLDSSPQNPCLSGSLFEQGWLADLAEKHPDAEMFFIIEGVLMYFDLNEVQQAITQMVSAFANCHIAFDSSSSLMCKMSKQHDSLKYTDARFKLCLDSPKDIEHWHKNIQLKSIKRYSDFEHWRAAGWFNYWLMLTIPPLSNASCLLHLICKER